MPFQLDLLLEVEAKESCGNVFNFFIVFSLVRPPEAIEVEPNELRGQHLGLNNKHLLV